MSSPYSTRNATNDEVDLFRLLLSTYRDGSGAEAEADGSTRANWRQIERCVAELVKSETSEDKNIFDVIAKDPDLETTYYGYSVKSKQLPTTQFEKLESVGRTYMEVANSPAKFWDAIEASIGIREVAFGKAEYANQIGDTLLSLVSKWHHDELSALSARVPGATLNLEASNYFCLSYSALDKTKLSDSRKYQIHVFDLEFPNNIQWEYTSPKCLRGYDPAYPDESLFDWYGLSGGQLKYYPRASSARYKSPVFKLASPPQISLIDKVTDYFPAGYQ